MFFCLLGAGNYQTNNIVVSALKELTLKWKGKYKKIYQKNITKAKYSDTN